ncbi:MAG: AAA family ATPase [Phaeodactylibacter sp.]|nr:AAA family ATPase [Phaeodactylibacter sp.]
MLPKLPIGQQDFRGIAEKGYLYVDKTRLIHRLATSGKYYFLSRPRRFGKSLTLSVIKELFSGSRELFKGLWVENHWDWSTRLPAIHLSFGSMGYKEVGLEAAIERTLDMKASEMGIELEGEGISHRFQDFLKKAARKGPVVLLIDEYDKPLIDYLEKDSLSTALAHQKILKSFYSIIKDNDAHIHFLLITGVSKFSKVGVFSDLNNLLDISLHPNYATLTGITEEELEAYFGPAIDQYEAEHGSSGLRQKIQEWYNGYSFDDGSLKVYNPFSLLSFFSGWSFKNFWFASGTPTFLINLLRERYFYDFEQVEAGVSAFESYNLEKLETVPLLFQTGYLTIKEYDPDLLLYTLDYPNREVKDSMLQHLIGAFRHGDVFESTPAVVRLYKAFLNNDLPAVMELINDLFQTIPYQLFAEARENLYHALIHLLFTYLGQYMQSEVSVLRGRLDAVVQTASHIYIFEFKLDESAKAALVQIRQKDYATPYRISGKQVVAVGVNFSSEHKAINDWEVAEL